MTVSVTRQTKGGHVFRTFSCIRLCDLAFLFQCSLRVGYDRVAFVADCNGYKSVHI
jgi:hypothetical protein